MKFFITGSRGFKDSDKFAEVIEPFMAHIDHITMEGGKERLPLEIMVREFCQICGIPFLLDFPNWYPDVDQYDKGAGLRTMNKIIKESDALIAFWDGESHGTKMAIEKALALGKKYKVYKYEDPMNKYFIFSNKSSYLHYDYPCEIFDRKGNSFGTVFQAFNKYKDAIQGENFIMLEANRMKFVQHPELKSKLKALGNKTIVFDSKITPWGIDLNTFGVEGLEDKNKNILGQILTELKEKL